MPTINLKPNSPEFADGSKPYQAAKPQRCDMPDCTCDGAHKAPKTRDSKDYYWFCLEHVQEYNKAWNYFEGMSLNEIEEHINKATIWDRPTRRYDTMANTETLRRKAWQTYHFTDAEPPRDSYDETGNNNHRYHGNRNTPEFESLALMGLEPPVDLDKIKERYRELAKKYHPDHNRDDPAAEETLKKINMAYTVLKMAYQKFDDLESK